LFLVIIILTLVVAVFGNSIRFFIHEYAPFLIDAVDLVVRMRTGVTFVILTIAISIIYKYLPSWLKTNKTTIRKQLPGAIIAASCWMMLSYVFSIYLDIFTTFSTIYGSMTTVILLMLWFYMCMHAILFGAKMNVYICRRFFDSK
jgi:membrane protein